MTEPFISIRNMTKTFGPASDPVYAVNDVSFDIPKGSITGLVGESGSGKSTLGRSLLRLIEPTSGSTVFDGCDLNSLKAGDLRAMRRRMQLRFGSMCRDSHGSGLSGTPADACNLAAVGIGLLQESAYVWVVGRGVGPCRHWQRWQLGDQGGSCVGVVTWMSGRGHVSRLCGRDVHVLVAQLVDGDPLHAPWWTSVVGAPKKKKLSKNLPPELALDQKVKTIGCKKDSKKSCNGKSSKCITHNFWDELDLHINSFFESKKLSDLLKNKETRI